MPDPIVTNVDLGNVVHSDGKFRDETFTAAGAGTIAEGTILARNSSSGKLEVYVSGGPNDTGVPKAVLTYDVVAGGAGDLQIRAMVSGNVRKERLVIAAGGTPSNAVLDQLRDYSIVPLDTQELNFLDNQ